MDIKIYATLEGKEPFLDWLNSLKDLKAKASVKKRLNRIEKDSYLGDYKFIEANLIELCFFMGPGYRVYCGMYEEQLIIFLAGGDKSSQERDLIKVKEYWNEFKNR